MDPFFHQCFKCVIAMTAVMLGCFDLARKSFVFLTLSFG